IRELKGKASSRKRCRRRMLRSSPASSLYTGTTMSTSRTTVCARRAGFGVRASCGMAAASAGALGAGWADAESFLGQLDHERRAAVGRVGRAHAAAVGVDDPGHDREAEA